MSGRSSATPEQAGPAILLAPDAVHHANHRQRGGVRLIVLVRDPFADWASDPYDPSFVGPALRNRADDPAWDADFPDHPLSRARRHLAAVQASLRIADALKRTPPFRPSR